MIIRRIRQAPTYTTPLPTPPTLAKPFIVFKTPGGTMSWDQVRLSNYTPWLATIRNTSDREGIPVQVESLLPFQQNVYHFQARTGTITIAFSEITFISIRLTNNRAKYYVIAEYGDEKNSFPGAYPNTLGGFLQVKGGNP